MGDSAEALNPVCRLFGAAPRHPGVGGCEQCVMALGISTWEPFPALVSLCRDMFVCRPHVLQQWLWVQAVCFIPHLTPFVTGWIPWTAVSVIWSFYFAFPASAAENSRTLQISSLLIVHIPLLSVTWESWTCPEPVGEGQALFYVLAPKLFLMGLEFLRAGAPGLTAGTVSQQWPGKMCCRWQGQLSPRACEALREQ